jgi:hypothetical protein
MRTGYRAFAEAREAFRERVARWSSELPGLAKAQDELRRALGYVDYRIETPIVYNEALDEVGPGSDVRFVLVGDNPGKNEQRADRRRYLVGQSGKIAERVFRELLGVDFRSQVVIVNKTPIHTAKTAELRKLLALDGSAELRAVFEESQRFMAALACDVAAAFDVPIWICGYGELGPKAIFSAWSEALKDRVSGGTTLDVWAFPHFSMNRFSIEAPPRFDPALTALENLAIFGRRARRERLGW